MLKTPLVVTAITAVVFALCAPTAAQAATGDINLTFSQAGFTTDPNEWGDSIEVAHDGTMLVGAHSSNSSVGEGERSYVVRLLADGSLDTSFGSDGYVNLFDFQSDAYPNQTEVLSIKESWPSGKILLTVVRPIDGNLGTTIVQLNANGSLDTSFGDVGFIDVVAPEGFATFLPYGGMSLQSEPTGENRIIVGGSFSDGGELGEAGLVAFTVDGVLDTSWGAGGYVRPPYAGTSDVWNMTTDAQGALYLAVNAWNDADHTAAVAKIDASGQLDENFGDGGVTVIAGELDASFPFSNQVMVYANKVAIDGHGNVVVAADNLVHDGGCCNTHRRAVVERLLPDGSPDTTFANEGRFLSTLLPDANAFAGNLVIGRDDTIFVGGSIFPSEGRQQFYGAALTNSGVLDLTFGEGGLVTYPAVGVESRMSGVALTAAGGLVAVMSADYGSTRNAQVVAIDTGDHNASHASLSVDSAIGSPAEGATVTFSLTGLKSISNWSLTAHSTPQVLSSGVVGMAGEIWATTTIPAGLDAGWHSLVLEGTDISGSAIAKTLWFQLGADGTLLATSTTEPALASTGFSSEPLGFTALIVLAAGVALVVGWRRRV